MIQVDTTHLNIRWFITPTNFIKCTDGTYYPDYYNNLLKLCVQITYSPENTIASYLRFESKEFSFNSISMEGIDRFIKACKKYFVENPDKLVPVSDIPQRIEMPLIPAEKDEESS